MVRASSSPHVVRVPLSDPAGVDPEEAFVAALSSCHMLFFLSFAARKGFVVASYEDRASGVLAKTDEGREWISKVTLRPHIVFEGDKRPEPVKQLLAAIAGSDGLVLCAPEFNHSIPGVLKNALDWASRPAFTSVMAYKPVAIMATSRGPLGGARCLEHMRVALDSMLSRVVLAREVTITATADKVRDGRLVDDTSLGFACGAVEALLREIRLWRMADRLAD